MDKQRATQQKTIPRNTWHRTRYAFHEAGHAVAGHVIGRCISEVSIVADRGRGYRGYCAFNAYAEDFQSLPQWRDGSKNPECTTIMYAGTIAMAILCEQRDWKYERWRGVDKADFDMIYLWSLEMFGENTDRAHAMQRACQKQAREILIHHWRAVEALASVLVAQGKVTGGEAHRLIQHVIDANVTDWRMQTWNTNIRPAHISWVP